MALLIVFMALYFLKSRDYLNLEENAKDSEDLIRDLQNENKWIKEQYFILEYIYIYIIIY